MRASARCSQEQIVYLPVAADTGPGRMANRLHDRLREIGSVLPVDHAMIAQEIVRTAARSDISEEVTRFRATSRTGRRWPTR